MRPAFTCGLLLLALGCSSKESSTSTAQAASNELTFSSDDYTIQPDEEKYICWAHTLSADQDVIVRQVHGDYGAATHHVFFAWTLAPEPEGQTECPVLFKTTWIPIYLGGKNTSPLQMPDGAAIDLGKGKQLLLQLHMQNVSSAPIVNKVTMHMELGEPGVTYTPAGIFGLDNQVISIPANTDNVRTSMACTPGKDMNVFAVLGHMHKMGKALSISKNGTAVFDEPWHFDEQPITPFQMNVTKTDSLGLSCIHDNTLSRTVKYGESSDDEMCASVFYYTPYDQLAGCINAPMPDAGAPPGDGGLALGK
jgi:hypothetical protein